LKRLEDLEKSERDKKKEFNFDEFEGPNKEVFMKINDVMNKMDSKMDKNDFKNVFIELEKMQEMVANISANSINLRNLEECCSNSIFFEQKFAKIQLLDSS